MLLSQLLCWQSLIHLQRPMAVAGILMSLWCCVPGLYSFITDIQKTHNKSAPSAGQFHSHHQTILKQLNQWLTNSWWFDQCSNFNFKKQLSHANQVLSKIIVKSRTWTLQCTVIIYQILPLLAPQRWLNSWKFWAFDMKFTKLFQVYASIGHWNTSVLVILGLHLLPVFLASSYFLFRQDWEKIISIKILWMFF